MNPGAAAFVPGSYAYASEPQLPTVQIISTEEDLHKLLSWLGHESIISVDFEGADLSKGAWRNGEKLGSHVDHGRICLMQSVRLGLAMILESDRVVKVVHDFRQDADALKHQYGIEPRGIFDCQLCNVFLRRLDNFRTNYVLGSSKLLSSYRIQQGSVAGYGVVTQEQKQRIHTRFSQDRHLWERRPLPADMVQYAVEDVKPMLQLQQIMFQELVQKLGNQQVAWQLMLEGSQAYAADFLDLECRCRLCCDAAANARFDGFRLKQRLQAVPPQRLPPHLLSRVLGREEDQEPLTAPGPSCFYVNSMDESVPLPIQ
ncbi:unnamed protein product [Effrenium voratum]|uniref:3'-5' exonuclease domain-containing protein n=1 Tax=Effrenium voratum TaxID=2562239 RepID=A0AA36NID6_9DINO|nr:unnamed protein product [Effrenium voratum]